MFRNFCAIATVIVASVLAIAQQPGPVAVSQLQLPLLAKLPLVSGATVQVVGNPGPQTIYYWIVPEYTLGQGPISGPFPTFNAPNILSASNSVQIAPIYPAGATSLDVLKTLSPIAPAGACACAVATGVAAGVISDQSNSTSSYTVNPQNLTLYTWTLDTEVVGAGAAHPILRQGATVIDLTSAVGAVTSVFGRTGAVVAAATDYKGVANLSLGDSVSDILFGSSAVTIGDRTPPATGDNILLGPYGTGGSANGIQLTGSNGTTVLIDNAPGADDFSVTGSGTFGHIAFVEGANDSQQTTTGWYSSHVMSSPHHAVGPICQAAGTAANPSLVACGANSGGAFSCATNASGGTCVVSTTAVCVPTPVSGTCDATNALTFASPIFVSQVTDEGAALGVTCNTNPVTALVSNRVNATSFTVTLGSFTTNPVCFDFVIQ